jgi:hypothetical protein
VLAMFSFLKKDPVKKLNKLYLQKLEEAMYAQRNGDIRSYSTITSEAEDIRIKMDALSESIASQ